MKPRTDVQRAHDLFDAIWAGRVPNPWPDVPDAVIEGIRSALAWVLAGEAGSLDEVGDLFDARLDEADEFLRGRGFRQQPQ